MVDGVESTVESGVAPRAYCSSETARFSEPHNGVSGRTVRPNLGVEKSEDCGDFEAIQFRIDIPKVLRGAGNHGPQSPEETAADLVPNAIEAVDDVLASHLL